MTGRTVGLTALTFGVLAAAIGGWNIPPAQAQVFIIESSPAVESAPFFDQSFHQPVTIDQHNSIGRSAHDMYMPSHSNIYTPSNEIMRIQTPHQVYQAPHRVYQAPTVYYQRTEIVSPDGSQRVILEDPVGYSPGYYSAPPRVLHRHHGHHDHRNFPSSIRIPVTSTQRFIYRF